MKNKNNFELINSGYKPPLIFKISGLMGEAKRRKQLLGDVYGSRVNLEKCPIPSEISLGYGVKTRYAQNLSRCKVFVTNLSRSPLSI
ncbi:hypothetical protein [Nostoc sphaeroides]|uniref:Uncharacterized protein n=1 Tax=Nostoc sphaeroides CCNUC1 TaxID=2653204 RepID=A0A5P8WJL9_9NOSO|nr:hypothetical protein [Nostoc sphaeroides]QFS52914.1 hypothetical protein GXM_10178 [Nostoc sphaeroides CCNUC1]